MTEKNELPKIVLSAQFWAVNFCAGEFLSF